MDYEREIVSQLESALRDVPPLLHIVTGPRQVGKTTAAQQVSDRLGWPVVFEAADIAPPPGPEWIETHWARARALPGQRVLLVLDEVHKVNGWSVTVKRLWDEERRRNGPVQPVLLGSSALQLQRGLTESLAGRFRLHRCMHWTFPECAQAFGWTLKQWLYFGGYPGAATLASREADWRRYVADALIETAIARDVVQLQPVTKPALLRNLFGLATTFPARILSYNKMLGQLHDAGNTTTLAHYVQMLDTAFLLSGLELYAAGHRRQRGSSPKLVLWNNALINASATLVFAAAQADRMWWGRLVENAVGGALLNGLPRETYQVTYWRDGSAEVDYVVQAGRQVWALEVKSGRPRAAAGLAAFCQRYPKAMPRLIGEGGIPLAEFFQQPVTQWLEG